MGVPHPGPGRKQYQHQQGGIDIATARLPQTLDQAYERILDTSSNLEEAKKLLHIVVAATRPLTLAEMALALALRESHRSYENLDLQSEERFREHVRDLCGLFVTIRASKRAEVMGGLT